MARRDGEQLEIIACTVKGKRCTALDKKRNKWTWDDHADYAAKLHCDAVNDRGYIYPKYWTKA